MSPAPDWTDFLRARLEEARARGTATPEAQRAVLFWQARLREVLVGRVLSPDERAPAARPVQQRRFAVDTGARLW